jgi:hypothetical protein
VLIYPAKGGGKQEKGNDEAGGPWIGGVCNGYLDYGNWINGGFSIGGFPLERPQTGWDGKIYLNRGIGANWFKHRGHLALYRRYW